MTASWGYRDPLPRHGTRDGDYVFDATEGERGVRFFTRRLWIPEGDYAGLRYVMPAYQDHYCRALYGWRTYARATSLPGMPTTHGHRRRRYRRTGLAIPRGNLKSMFLSGVALKGLTADGYVRPVVTGAGTDRDNAAIIFGYAAYSAMREAAMRRRLRVFHGTKRIVHRASGGRYRVIAARDTHAHGGHPTHIVIDDLQAQPNPGLLAVMRTSQRTLSDSLLAMAMTAGLEMTGVGWDEWNVMRGIEDDPATDPEYLVAMYYPRAADGSPASADDVDVEDRTMWRAVNPALGVSIPEAELAKAVADMLKNPSHRAEVLTLHFNVWVDAAAASWIAPESWRATAGTVDPASLRMRACWAGVVASSSTDIASVVYAFPPTDAAPRWRFVLDAFVPADNVARIEEDTRVAFRPFIDEGWLTPTVGNVIDEAMIRASIDRRRDAGWRIQDIAVNPRGGVGLMTALTAAGYHVSAVTPGYNTMSGAMRDFEEHVMNRRIAHGGDRLLAWMMRNLRAKKTGMGDLMPDGSGSRGNITGAVAALLAYRGAVTPPDEDKSKKTQRWGAAS